jgi:cyclopropane-fatty-acyl-phospholipid synthase
MPQRQSAPLGLQRHEGSISAAHERAGTRSLRPDRWVASKVFELVGRIPLELVLWDGTRLSPSAPAIGRLRILDRGALYRLLLDPQTSFGDLYTEGRITLDGDLVAALIGAYRLVARSSGLSALRTRVDRWREAAPSISRARRNIHHHYDLSNDFYRLWLDREALQYTCAYYADPEMTLEQAQLAKADHVCRKLWLKPGERVVEAGCGWGGFALHMARRFGVRVRAYNISREQIRYAREWAVREGLDGQVEFVEDDFRTIDGTYDVFVSIGMLEHVGLGNYEELGAIVDRCLTPEGRGLIHTIGRDRPAPLNRWIRRRIFPGAYPPTLREMTPIFESAGLSVLDVENIRLHYARTLEDWLKRFEQHADQVREMFDEPFVRAWRLYLSGSVAGFVTGSLQLFQVLFARSAVNEIPWNRTHVYNGEPPVRCRI